MAKNIKTFEDACAALEMDPQIYVDDIQIAAFKKLKVIVKALNAGWEPNWKDEDERKYYPWWNMEDGGFSLLIVLYGCQYTSVPSCLCFQTSGLAEYAAKQFKSIYKDLYCN